jgi:hypothetical protein
MDIDRNNSRTGKKPAVSDGRSGAFWAVVALGAVAAVLVASIALMYRHGPDEPETVAAPRRESPTAARHASGFVARLREGAGSDASRGGGARLPAPPALEREATPDRVAAAATPAVEEEEEVIDNVPGKEFPRGIDAAEYIQKLRDMGETEGIAAFPPPGTDPPKAGVVVPDDYDVPEGYERYYQYTDDGKPLDPILLFSPEYDFFDDQGNPVPIPEDRVVPPDQAPGDLPVEILDPESPREPGGLIGQDD